MRYDLCSGSRYLGGCVTACYVHYPTISTDMFERVAQRRATYNNASFVSRSQTLSRVKVVYYKLFAWLYGIAGRRSDVVLVNSTWTFNHIVSLWQGRDHTFIVHPPCDVQEFLSIPLTKERTSDPQRTRTIVSVAQFRPEKDHGLQLAAFSRFLKMMSINEQGKYRLVLIGGCRNEDDTARVHDLRTLASEFNISDNVEFCLNVPFDELKQRLAGADVGLHTMWNEHFGIGLCCVSSNIFESYIIYVIEYHLFFKRVRQNGIFAFILRKAEFFFYVGISWTEDILVLN